MGEAATIPSLAALALLGFVLTCGAVVHADITRRRIPNGLCVAIGAMALVYATACGGWAGIVDFATRGGIAVLVAVPLLMLFAMRQIGGGDVKLALALLLWIPVAGMPLMLGVTVLTGAFLALALKLLARLFCFVRADSVPYGVAIVAGALVSLAPPIGSLAMAACSVMA
ncbi:prepilin peptidase [Novosphingobium kaempferiae]|uniref:prepilin peptidase n=1 Tax=Novosphingobium kaempferiae TaxID=2896849 RepID=UPI001E4FC553|nr:prepilin peptidase [Novosphingobium kaempferiae]